MDPSVLYRKLEYATFSQRDQIAADVARDSSPAEIAALVAGLAHPTQTIRLGIIEILRHARSRDVVRNLFEHARSHDGDDRVFALRALVELAEPGDDFLADTIKRWLTSPDPFVQAHAAKLAGIVAVGGAPPPEPVVVVEPTAENRAKLDRLVRDLFSAVSGNERFGLVVEIERRGPHALVAAAKLTLQKGSADLVAYICRALIRQAAVLPAREALLPLLQSARRRVDDAPLATAAIDDALIALGGQDAGSLLARIGELDATQLDAVVARLTQRSAAEVALHVPRLLDVLAGKPALWSSLGPALAYAAGDVRTTTRGELRRLTELVLDDLRHDRRLPPVTVVAACRVLAQIAEPGESLSHQLRVALERIAAPEAATALCALCTRLATEEAAGVVVAMLRDPLEPARVAAQAAIAAWRSPWVTIAGDLPAITTRYSGETAQALSRHGSGLIDLISGEDYAVDGRGTPIRYYKLEYGACTCCSPPRALVRCGTDGLRCPSSWTSYLREAGRSRRESEHAFGGCRHCDSIRARVRDGVRIVCRDCGSWNYEGR